VIRNSATSILVMALACFIMAGAIAGISPAAVSAASDVIQWGEEEGVIYDRIHPYTLNWSGDVLDRGGLNLVELYYTEDGSEADIVINQYGAIGASAIRELDSSEELSEPTDRNLTGFTNSLEMEQGSVYLVVLHDGSHAKLRIDRILPTNGFSITKVHFTYVLEVPEEEHPIAGNSGNAGSLDLGSPAEDMLAPAATYVFEEDGAITFPWKRLADEATYDIYRSDNGAPYVKMTDFMITETEYTDHYTFAGHTYLYKLASYDKFGDLLSISSAIQVKIVKKGSLPADSEKPANNVIQLQIGSRTAYVNDVPRKLEAAPFTHNGRTVLPLRFVGEALGATVKWNAAARSITLKSANDTIVLVLDSSTAQVNGKVVMMDVPAFVHNQITMVPIRFVSEQLRQKITFDNATQTILIEGQASSAASGNGDKGNKSDTGNSPSPAESGSDYFIGDWSMWVPAGKSGADGGTLSIYEDGTISYYWNGPQTGTWEWDEATGKLLLYDYKSGWDWTVTRTDKGITVSTFGVHETGTRK
jgi:hypothetical protein